VTLDTDGFGPLKTILTLSPRDNSTSGLPGIIFTWKSRPLHVCIQPGFDILASKAPYRPILIPELTLGASVGCCLIDLEIARHLLDIH